MSTRVNPDGEEYRYHDGDADFWDDVYSFEDSRSEPESEWSDESYDSSDYHGDHDHDHDHGGHGDHHGGHGGHHGGHGDHHGGHGDHHGGHGDDHGHPDDDGWWPWNSREDSDSRSGSSSHERFTGSDESRSGSSEELDSAALCGIVIGVFLVAVVVIVLIVIMLKRRASRRAAPSGSAASSYVAKSSAKPRPYATANPLYGSAPQYQEFQKPHHIAAVHFTPPNAPPPIYTSQPDLKAASHDVPPPSYSSQPSSKASSRDGRTSSAITPARYASLRSGSSAPPMYETIGSSAPY